MLDGSLPSQDWRTQSKKHWQLSWLYLFKEADYRSRLADFAGSKVNGSQMKHAPGAQSLRGCFVVCCPYKRNSSEDHQLIPLMRNNLNPSIQRRKVCLYAWCRSCIPIILMYSFISTTIGASSWWCASPMKDYVLLATGWYRQYMDNLVNKNEKIKKWVVLGVQATNELICLNGRVPATLSQAAG